MWQYRKFMRKSLLIFAVGCVLALLAGISEMGKEVLHNGRILYRNTSGEGEQTIRLSAESENGELAEAELTVQANRYSEAELQILYEKLLMELPDRMLNDNASFQEITQDLYLPGQLKGYPFTLSWQSSAPGILTEEGEILAGVSSSVTDIILTLTVTCEEFEEKQTFALRVRPDLMKESYQDAVNRLVCEAEEQSRDDEKIVLPDEINGEKITWREKKEKKGLSIFFLSILAAVLAFVAGIRARKKRQEQILLQMEEEYGTVVNKLTLYLGAGLSILHAWEKTAAEGAKRNPVYEQMRYTAREIQSGVPEAEAYENFGKRMCQKNYIRLTALLTQSLQKGNQQLFMLLKREVLSLSEERTAMSRKKGEEASTGLLFPMMLMLGMTMVLLMFPAFLSL